jgi:serine/threonine protein kinase
MLRQSGEVALIDFGFSRHLRLPDILAEEFPVPIGTGPYISPEQLFGNRSDPRSDIFALGVILYFFVTGERPFGDPNGLREWRRRLYRKPTPPRALRADCPAWLQELILRCLEVDPRQRHASAAQLAFDLQHPQQVLITARGERNERDGWLQWLNGRVRSRPSLPVLRQTVERQLEKSPIIMAAIDLSPGMEPLAEAMRLAVRQILAAHPDARLTCVNVLRLSPITLDASEDEQGRNLHLRRLAELQYWAKELPVPRTWNHLSRVRSRKSRNGAPGLRAQQPCRSHRDRGARQLALAAVSRQHVIASRGRGTLHRHGCAFGR